VSHSDTGSARGGSSSGGAGRAGISAPRKKGAGGRQNSDPSKEGVEVGQQKSRALT
jgi:hypothetical protein